MNKKTIRLANGSSINCSPAKEATVRGWRSIIDNVPWGAGDRAHVGWKECRERCIQILESHLKSYIAPEARLSQTEPDLLYIDTAALEEIKRL